MIIVIILLGIRIIIREVHGAKNETKQYQAVQLFDRMDDLAHTQMQDMQARGNPSHFT